MGDDTDPLAAAITAANLLDTTVFLCAKACELAAQTGSTEEWEQHADYVAACLSRPVQTRVMARDFMAVAADNARRRIGADDELAGEQYVSALRLVAAFQDRVLTRMAALEG
ncbi:MAG: hypothetical protein JWO90_2089 [Solirubrobacterales bacterium]|jgi:hypothetical protein|nr:hypothetical protein [Solirubrobacterales bacterium]